ELYCDPYPDPTSGRVSGCIAETTRVNTPVRQPFTGASWTLVGDTNSRYDPTTDTIHRVESARDYQAGTWAPNITYGANVEGHEPTTCQYQQIHNVVTGSCKLAVTAINGGRYSNFHFSLPLPSNFTDANQAVGTATITVDGIPYGQSAFLSADGATLLLGFVSKPGATRYTHVLWTTFSYRLQ